MQQQSHSLMCKEKKKKLCAEIVKIYDKNNQWKTIRKTEILADLLYVAVCCFALSDFNLHTQLCGTDKALLYESRSLWF